MPICAVSYFIVCCYIPPKPDYNSKDFVNAVRLDLDDIVSQPGDFVILVAGDFNQLDTSFLESDYGLIQLVSTAKMQIMFWIKFLQIDLKNSTSCGPDGLPPVMFRNLTGSLAGPLSVLFNNSMSVGKLPTEWKKSYCHPHRQRWPCL